MRALAIALASAALVCSACGPREEAIQPASTEANAAPAPAPPSPSRARPRIVVLGDSLTAGLGLAPTEAYPHLLQQRLTDGGLDYEVVNAGVSGDTSAGGLSRLDWAIEGEVRILIVALGGNDALRGLAPEELKRNLTQIIERAQARDIRVVLAGMEAPPNFGRDYSREFRDIYPALAKEYNVALVPFLLDGVGGVMRLNQRDGIHPNAEGARILADNVWTVLKPIVEPQGS
ncbi:MAG: arylesterase [Acidobacteria bacterium]|nr:arylesterase [Acidobacteriota bacterium]